MDFFSFMILGKSIAMNNNQILSASLLDILFDGRNKDYGAYELRAGYPKRIRKALSAAAIAVAAVAGIASVDRSAGNDNPFNDKEKIVVVQMLDEPEEVKPPEPPPAQPTEPPPVHTEQLSSIAIEPDDEVMTSMPTQEDLRHAKVDVFSQDGPQFDGAVMPTDVLADKKGIIEGPAQPAEPVIWGTVEKDAEFPGGMVEWLKFLERNCNGQVASDNGAAAGRYTVVIRFVVDEEGNVSGLAALTAHGHGMEEEAMRVIKRAAKKKWIPALQNGRHVKAYRSQPITFEVKNDY